MWDYRGKVAVVTGASAGLGRRLALDLSSAGAVVVGVARREERLQALVDEMRTHSAESSYRVCDLSEATSFVGLLDQVEGNTAGSTSWPTSPASAGSCAPNRQPWRHFDPSWR